MAATARTSDKLDPKVLRTGADPGGRLLAVVFDTTIVSVALHSWRRAARPVSTIQWVTPATCWRSA